MAEVVNGTLLIAEPFLKDPAFMRTVVLVCRHSKEEGTFGFILNRKLDKTLDQLVSGVEPFQFEVFAGGPVQEDTLHFIHNYPQFFPDAEKVTDGVYWGGDFNLLKELLWDGKITEDNIRFILGYSGWTLGQLEDELQQKSWLLLGGDKNLILDTAPADLWKKCLYTLGGEYKMMAHFPTDPQLN